MIKKKLIQISTGTYLIPFNLKRSTDKLEYFNLLIKQLNIKYYMYNGLVILLLLLIQFNENFIINVYLQSLIKEK